MPDIPIGLDHGDMPPSLKPLRIGRKAFRPTLNRLSKSPRCGICRAGAARVAVETGKEILRARLVPKQEL